MRISSIALRRSSFGLFGALAIVVPGIAAGQSLGPNVQTSIAPLPVVLRSIPMGHANPQQVLHLAISIAPLHPEQLQAFADAVSNPDSPQYRQFITPEQVGEMFGQPVSTVSAISSYLTAQGMKVTLVAKNRLNILADCTVAQAEKTFGTSIENFQTVRPGEPGHPSFLSATTNLTLPATISKVVYDISGLETFTAPQRRTLLYPYMARTLYNTAPMYNGGSTGLGRTVGISNWDGYSLDNLPLWYSNNLWTLPAPAGGVGSNCTITALDGGSGSGTEDGEGDLDIQMVLGQAPLCNLVIYDGHGGDIVNVLTQEANDNTCDLISESWGWSLDSGTETSCHNEHLSMTSQGMTYLAASGDSGTSIEPYHYPDIDPEVLLVGGTEATTDANGNRTAEVGWPGGGGGWSTDSVSFNTQPSWQQGTGIPTANGHRLIPDVSGHADDDTNGAYLFVVDNNGYSGQGTSFASPICAGQLAITQQKAIADGRIGVDGSGHYRFGRLQDKLYGFNGSATIFHDITSGSNGVLPDSTTSNAGTGWDFATGWGPMDFNALEQTFSFTNIFSGSTITPVNSVAGGSTVVRHLKVTLTSPAPAGGTVVTLASNHASVASVPTTMTIPHNKTSASVVITHHSVASDTNVTFTASVSGMGSTSAVLSVLAPRPQRVNVVPAESTGGDGSSVTGTITLNAPAPTGGCSVALSSNITSAATTPASVTVTAGNTQATFAVTTHAVGTSKLPFIKGTLNGTSKTFQITVDPPKAQSLSLNHTTVQGSSSTVVTGTVTISPAAPTGGVVVTLSSSNTAAASVPGTVTVLAGATTATFTVTHHTVATSTVATIGATSGGATRTKNLTVTP